MKIHELLASVQAFMFREKNFLPLLILENKCIPANQKEKEETLF